MKRLIRLPESFPDYDLTSMLRVVLLLIAALVCLSPASGQNALNVKDFGARGDGIHDDYPAIQQAVDSAIRNPAAAAIRFPPGRYRITRPILLQQVLKGHWRFFTIRLFGDVPAKSAPDAYLSTILCDFTEGFALGIQRGRGIHIENLNFVGKYHFPLSITNKNIGTTPYSAWNNGSVHDTRYAPYAGIVIDPFCDPDVLKADEGYRLLRNQYLPGNGRGGTSDVEIKECAVHQFAVGIMLTPNPLTQNDEMINLTDDDVDGVKVAIAVGQDQSKEIHIDRLKCWASTYTILDGMDYGRGTGGGSVMINGMNIAGNVNQLFEVSTSRFPLSAMNVYSESLFRIGYVGGASGANFINFQIDLLTGPGMPAADYILSGGPVTFYGGMLRYYDNNRDHRMNLSNARITFRDMTMSNPPIVTGLYGLGTNHYPVPEFENVYLYYGASAGTTIGKVNEDFVKLPLSKITIDRSNWTGYFESTPAILRMLKPGEYIVAAPTSTSRLRYDQSIYAGSCETIQVGRISSIKGNRVNLDDVGLNAGGPYDAVYLDTLR